MSQEEIEKIFLPKLRETAQQFLNIINYFLNKRKRFSKEFYLAISREADRVEIFLDGYGARSNKRFFYFGELVASARWITQAMFSNLHIVSRIDAYKLGLTPDEEKKFLEDLESNLVLLANSIKVFLSECIAEAGKIGIIGELREPEENILLPEVKERKILPPDFDQKPVEGSRDRVIGLLMKFLEAGQEIETFARRYESQDAFTEENLENFRSAFHRLQSLYDTYLDPAATGPDGESLRSLRGCISVNLHLLEICRSLIHFHERHTARLVDFSIEKPQLRLVEFGKIPKSITDVFFPYVVFFSRRGKALAENVFRAFNSAPDEYILETAALIISPYRIEDFHLRPIMPVTQIAQKYSINTDLYFNRKRYDLKSPLEMAMAIPDIRERLSQENVRIIIRGPRKAMDEIKSFFRETCGAIPEEETIKK